MRCSPRRTGRTGREARDVEAVNRGALHDLAYLGGAGPVHGLGQRSVGATRRRRATHRGSPARRATPGCTRPSRRRSSRPSRRSPPPRTGARADRAPGARAAPAERVPRSVRRRGSRASRYGPRSRRTCPRRGRRSAHRSSVRSRRSPGSPPGPPASRSPRGRRSSSASPFTPATARNTATMKALELLMPDASGRSLRERDVGASPRAGEVPGDAPQHGRRISHPRAWRVGQRRSEGQRHLACVRPR